ncbi:hypothetical protein BH10ACT3_BH10ACT3_22680 [soil metagenome]
MSHRNGGFVPTVRGTEPGAGSALLMPHDLSTVTLVVDG